MNGTILYVVTIMMLLLGICTHWLKSMIQARRTEGLQTLSVSVYWLRFWPESLVTLFSGIAGYVFLIDSDNLTALNAYGIGYIANSLADIIGTRVAAMVSAGPTQVQPPNGTKP